jgi:outer membrane protein TolC
MIKYILSTFILISVQGFAQDITLQQAKQQALENNNILKNSSLSVEEAKSLKAEAKTNYFPKVSVVAFGMKAINPLLELKLEGGNLPVYDGNPANLLTANQFAYMPGINMSLLNQLAGGAMNVLQPVYAGNRIKTGNKLADINLEVKKKQEDLARKEILFKTEEEYWRVINLYEKETVLKGYEDFLDTLSKEVSTAVKSGVTIKNDLLKVTVKRSELRLKRLQLENGVVLATRQLCQTTGIPYNANLKINGEPNVLNAPSFYYIEPESAVKLRNEYRLLENSITASQLQTELKRGDARPSVNVGLSGFYLDQLSKNLDGQFNGMAFVGLSVPISNWWEDKHKIKQLITKEDIAKNELKEGVGSLNLQIEKSWRDLDEAYKSIQLNEETLLQTLENRRVNEQSYKNGLSQMSDLLDSQAQVSDTREKLIESKINYQIAVAKYLKVTGR